MIFISINKLYPKVIITLEKLILLEAHYHSIKGTRITWTFVLLVVHELNQNKLIKNRKRTGPHCFSFSSIIIITRPGLAGTLTLIKRHKHFSYIFITVNN